MLSTLIFGLAALASAEFTYDVNFRLEVQEPKGSELLSLFGVFGGEGSNKYDVKLGTGRHTATWACNGSKQDIKQGKGIITIGRGEGDKWLYVDPDASNNSPVRYGTEKEIPGFVKVTLSAPSEPRSMLTNSLFAACSEDDPSKYPRIINVVSHQPSDVPESCKPVNIYPVAWNTTYIPPTGNIQPVRCYTMWTYPRD